MESKIMISFSLKTVKLIFLATILCSCDLLGNSYHFENTTELKESDVYGKWAPEFVPDQAKNIQLWHDIDTNSVRLEFSYSGQRPLKTPDMQTLDLSMKKQAVKGYPALSDGEHIKSIQYSCSRTNVLLDSKSNKSLVYSEVQFVGDTGEKVYYWNTSLDATYDQICTD
jgi:hypothetical protein